MQRTEPDAALMKRLRAMVRAGVAELTPAQSPAKLRVVASAPLLPPPALHSLCTDPDSGLTRRERLFVGLLVAAGTGTFVPRDVIGEALFGDAPGRLDAVSRVKQALTIKLRRSGYAIRNARGLGHALVRVDEA